MSGRSEIWRAIEAGVAFPAPGCNYVHFPALPAQILVMGPNSPARPAQQQIPTIRDLVRRRVEETGLRKVARQIRMSPSGLSSFLEGTAPYQKSIRKLHAWYRRELATGEPPVDVETTAAALRVLARLVPPAGRSRFVDCTLEVLTRRLPAGAQLPVLLAPYDDFIRSRD